MVEFETGGGEGRLVLTTEQIVEMLRLFQAESTNEARLVDLAETTIKKAAELGFLRRLRTPTINGRSGGFSRHMWMLRRCRTSRVNSMNTQEGGPAMTDALFSVFDYSTDAGAGYRLQYLEVFNWGTFSRIRCGG